MKHLVFKYLLIFTFTSSFCQENKNYAYIKFKYINKSVESFSLTKTGIRNSRDYVNDVEVPIKENKEYEIKVALNKSCFFQIGDLFVGHTIFLSPNDSVDLTFYPVLNATKELNEGKNVTKLFEIKPKFKYYGNIIYFDELEKLIGVTLKYKFEDPISYKNKCDKAYETSLNLLTQYIEKGIVSMNFVEFAKEDLKARYLLWFCEMLLQINKDIIPPLCFDKVNKFSFSDSVYATASDKYLMAASVIVYYIYNNFNPKEWHQNLDNEFASASSKYSGILRDEVMAGLLTEYVGKGHASFDSCYQVFLATCTNYGIKERVKRKVTNYRPTFKVTNSTSLAEILKKVAVENYKGENLFLSSLFNNGKPILIDCWASWCMPCKTQTPYLEDFRKKYSDKLEVIYISFDKKREKWMEELRRNKLPTTNHFLLANDFNAEFAQYFKVESIPRYILIDESGSKVLSSKMPFPALKTDFEEELNKYLR